MLLCERVGKRLSYNKLAKVLGITRDTVMDYVSYFEEVFLIYQVNRYAKSLNAVMKSPKKIYLADIGIKNIFVGFRDKGALFENLVFLKIKQNKPNYFFEDGKEIDFIVKDYAIEVKFRQVTEEELMFFNNSKFKKKILVTNYKDYLELDKLRYD